MSDSLQEEQSRCGGAADIPGFSSFGLSAPILEALALKGFIAPSSIQLIALPRLLAEEGHLIVKARTGTGKTAAFGIPLVERFIREIWISGHAPKALILTPTRELALQITREIGSFSPGSLPRITAVYGGASIRNQIFDLKRGTEIVVGTPGRIMDLMDRKALDLSAVEWFILDEADEMLDMGFFEDVEKILKGVRPDRRVALFSATMPEGILRVVREHIGEVEILEDTAPEDEKPAVDQYYMVLKKEDRLEALRRIIDGAEDFYGLIFCATKAGAAELARRLIEGGYPAEAIHGDLSQEVREETLRRFRARRGAGGEASILTATDVAARGLDIERLTHVINWDLPGDRESYIHRIGRTGRAGRRGRAISLILPAERGRISHLSRNMERTLGSPIRWMNVPPVKGVMKSLRRRIVARVLEVLPQEVLPPAGPENRPSADFLPEGPIQETPPSEGPAREIPPPAALPPDAPVPGASLPETPAPEPFLPVTVLPEMPGSPPESSGEVSLSPYVGKVARELIEKLGAERAVEALILSGYGELLDPSRYGQVMEFSEADPREIRGGGRRDLRAGKERYAREPKGFSRREAGPGRSRAGRGRQEETPEGLARVYVGLGRRHGAGARDVALLLMRAGGVPGRLIDGIELQDYCAFATLPTEAARRACVFSRNTQKHGESPEPVIRPASAR
jgi:ATP-dependent RNA helicase DeaD